MRFSSILATIILPISCLGAQVQPTPQTNNRTPNQAITAIEEIFSQIGTNLIQRGPELLADLELMVKGASDLAAGNPFGITSLAKGLADAGKMVLPVIVNAIEKAKKVGSGRKETACLIAIPRRSCHQTKDAEWHLTLQ